MTPDIEKIYFLDIETVSLFPEFNSMDKDYKDLWIAKAQNIPEVNGLRADPVKDFSRSGIYAEFGRVVSISIGCIRGEKYVIHTFSHDNEKVLLEDFSKTMGPHLSSGIYILCGHNLKEFDIPFLCRRMIVNQVEIPLVMDLRGSRPSANPHLDTLDLWKFGDFKHYTPLNLLAKTLGVKFPGVENPGIRIHGLFWGERNWEEIIRINQSNLLTASRIYLRMTQNPFEIRDENVLVR